MHKSVDKLIDPGVTVYASALNPETKLRTNTIEAKEIIRPRIKMSPKKSEKVNEHYLDKGYNWRLKREFDLKNAPYDPLIKSPLMKGKKNPPIVTERSKDSEPEVTKVEVKVVFEKRPERSRFVQGLHDRLAL